MYFNYTVVPHKHNGPVTTGDFIFVLFAQKLEVSQNTLKIHGRVLGHIPFTTDDFIHDTGHDRRLYTRLTQLCEVPQNTLKIHGRIL